MPFINTDKIPQNREPIVTTNIDQLFTVLPKKIPYNINVWVIGKMGQFGITTGNIVFTIEQDTEPSNEMMQYFDSLVLPLGIHATAIEHWKLPGQRIYDKGVRVKKYQSPSLKPPVLTVEELFSKLPTIVPYTYDIDLTGSLLKNGWSAHDVDLIIEDIDVIPRTRRQVGKYFTDLIGWRFDVGQKCMDYRHTGEALQNVYKAPLYKKGKLIGKLWQPLPTNHQ